jgi:hypothetical protein
VLEARHLYVSLVRAQLSADELALIFYACLADRIVHGPEREQFLPLVEKYALLRDLSPASLLDRSHKELLPITAFDASFPR